MRNFVKEEFTLRNLGSQMLWALILAGLTRLAILVFGVSVAHKDWYWVVVPAFYLAIAVSVMVLRRRVPDLVGAIDAVSSTGLVEIPGKTFAFMIASVTNRGTPSIADGWSLAITLTTGQVVTTSPHHVLVLNLNGRVFRGEDSLVAKALVPIAMGAKVRGTLMFSMTGVTPQDIARVGTKYMLRFNDFQGNISTVDWTWLPQGATQDIGYLGGLLPFETATQPATTTAQDTSGGTQVAPSV